MTAPHLSLHKQLNLEALSPEARAAAQARKVSGNWELKPLIRLLGELAHVDEAVEQQATKAKSRMILFTVLSFGSIFGAIVIAVILELGAVVMLLPLGIVLAVMFGMRWRVEEAGHDQRFPDVPAPGSTRHFERSGSQQEDQGGDGSHRSGRQEEDQQLDLPPGRFQKLTETIYTDPWCEVKLPLADGTTVILAFENYYCKMSAVTARPGARSNGRPSGGRTSWLPPR